MKTKSFKGSILSRDRLTIADLIIDLDKMQAMRDNTILSLKEKEFQLLKYLASRKNRIVPKSTLIEAIWKGKIRTNTLQAYMNSLHKKVDGSFTPRLIYTASGKGYLLAEENSCEVRLPGSQDSYSS